MKCPPDAAAVNEATTHEAAVLYTRAGLKVIPIPHRSKECYVTDWSNLDLAEADLPMHFPPGKPMNIGCRLGEPSAGLLDVDLDCDEAKTTASIYLPYTTWVSGHAGNPESHFWYLGTEPVATEQLKDLDGTMLVELRSTGAQTVVPPSTHKDGHSVTWHRMSGAAHGGFWT